MTSIGCLLLSIQVIAHAFIARLRGKYDVDDAVSLIDG